MKNLPEVIGRLLDAYGALFLARSRAIGALVLAATLCDPATGSVGAIAGVAAIASRAALRLPPLPGQADLLTAIYAGLALGAFHGNEPRSLALGVFGGLLAVPLCAALRHTLSGTPETGARTGLPLLGAPFLVTAWVLLAAAKGLAVPARWAWPAWPEWLPLSIASALANVGALFYVAHPFAGVLVLAALLIASRALALLAVGGTLLAHALVLAMTPTPPPGLPLLAAFNGALTAIFIGGVLSTPTLRTLAVAAGGVLVSTALSAGMLTVSTAVGIPPLSAPFLLTVWLAHAALRPEASLWWARFWLPSPARPEDSLVAGRLAAARGLSAGSVALLPPLPGSMEVSQASDAEPTHTGPWRYALDFVRTTDGVSFRHDGQALADFHVYDQPVLSPAYGTVVACRDDLADNVPGEMNLVDNWGNHVLLDIGGGLFVLLAHLRQGSLAVGRGYAVTPGTALARVGNSGRSAQPHLHMHVQRGSHLGAATVPFHLSRCLVDGCDYQLDATPGRGARIEAAAPDPALAQAFAVPHGRIWKFAGTSRAWQLTADTGLLGRSTLASDRGGQVSVATGAELFALHRRTGAADITLDAFVLAFGLTPFATSATRWRDAPDAALLPLPLWQRVGVLLAHPFGANLESRYLRGRDPGGALWRQSGTHRLATAFGTIEAETVAWFSESMGPVAFSLAVNGRVVLDFGLAGYGNRGDHGVPAWFKPSLTTAP